MQTCFTGMLARCSPSRSLTLMLHPESTLVFRELTACALLITDSDVRTLDLQVHLPHFRKPVAEIHGKLLDHCQEEKKPLAC